MTGWITYTSAIGIIFSSSLGVSKAFMIKIGHLVGEQKIIVARQQSILYFMYVFIVSLIFTVPILIYSSEIARLFIDNEEIVPLVSDCLWILSTYIYAFLILYTFFSLFRILNMDAYFFKMISLFFPACNILLASFFAFTCGMELWGILWGVSASNNIIIVIFFIKMFKNTEWESQVLQNKDFSLAECEI